MAIFRSLDVPAVWEKNESRYQPPCVRSKWW
jgi:hypothetical protein